MAGLRFGQADDGTTVNDPAQPGEQPVGPVDLPQTGETPAQQETVATETPKEDKLVNVLYVGKDTYKSDSLGNLSKGDERAVTADTADELVATGDFVRL